jgi:hypothetical protein
MTGAGAGVRVGNEVDVHLDVDEEIEWWRPLVHWVLVVPHGLATGALTAASLVVMFAIGLAVLVTGRVPQRLAAFQVMTVRERVRCYGFFFVLRRSLPPLSFAVTADDPGDDASSRVSVRIAPRLPRWSIFLRLFVLLPHLVVLIPIGVVMDLCYPVWMGLAAVNRGWPPSLQRTLLAVEHWVVEVAMYGLLVTERPPAFGLRAHGDERVAGTVTA